MAQGKNEEAKLLYERALSRGKGNGEAYYDFASLLFESKAPTVDVITLLQKSIDLQQDWFPSRFLLGSIYSKEQRYADAIPQLEAALAMHPHDKAAKLELENARRRGVQQQTPTVTIQYPEKLKVDTNEISGMFVQLDCLGNLARMVIQSEGKRQFLLVTDPSAVTIKGGGSTNLEFACGPATPRKVRVLYKPGEDHVRGTAGEVTQIEFQ
jgi:tetratricopeptide (TPR) repeat protein